jgi:enterochelin esterase-like enzyme
MRRMSTRQVIHITTYFALLAVLSACLPSNDISPTQAGVTPTATATATLPPTLIPATPTATPLTCLTESGLVKQDVVQTTKPPQSFFIYLPSCYEDQPAERFPVLYLLHGQTYNQDQWVRLGTPAIADQLILAHESPPFIMVFPDDRYWNSAAGPGFGDRFINDLIPYVDQNYRTLADREHRALGGLSRGGGWAMQLGLEHPELFGALGLHSPAIFKDMAPFVENYIQAMPVETHPNLWLDIGDSDKELGYCLVLEDTLTRNDYFHEFHLFAGDHTEKYWSAHTETYLRWYTKNWQEAPLEQ